MRVPFVFELAVVTRGHGISLRTTGLRRSSALALAKPASAAWDAGL